MRPTRRTIAVIGLAAAMIGLGAGCSAGPAASSGSPAPKPLVVVTTTSVFADMVSNVGGDLVQVTSLVPRNGDVHTFEPRPKDARAIASAGLLVMNGLGLDDWLTKILTAASATGTPLLKLGVDLPGVTLLPGETAATENPHLWLDVKYAEGYVDRIAAGLGAADPARAAIYTANATTYKTRLDVLDASVRAKIATIPPESRKLVTFHDAFPYYARAYGIAIVGVAVEAPGQDPSATYIASLITAMKAAGVKAIFSERQFPTKVIDALAAQAGSIVVSNLFDDALGDPPVTSYEAVITWDTDQLVAALR